MTGIKRFLALAVAFAAAFSFAEMTVVAVDTNNTANVDRIAIGRVDANTETVNTISIGTAVLSDSVSLDKDGVEYVSEGGKTMSFLWPTNYVAAYTNYPGRFDSYVDPLVTEWLLNKSVQGLKADLSVFGDPDFFVRYTNSPPTNIYSLLGYVSNCVYLLSNVKVEMSYTSLSNEIDQLKTRIERTERTSDRFGDGVGDLDYIINSDIEDLDAENMLDMIKVLATYIKYGATNGVSNTTSTGE